MTGEGDVSTRLGIDGGSTASTASEVALRRIEHWRGRAAHPLSGRELEEACEIVARSYEGLYVELVAERDH